MLKNNDKLIDIVFNYLKGESIASVRIKLEELCTTADAKVLFKNKKINKDILEGLLILLCVPEEARQNYTIDNDFFELLTQLHLDGYRHNHLSYLIKLIELAKYPRSWHIQVAIITFFTTALGLICYISPAFAEMLETQFFRITPFIFHWLEKTFSILRNLPLVGMTYAAVKLISTIYKTIFHGSTNISQKLTTLSFQLFSGGFSLAAYVLSYFAAGVATPLAGAFFVSSAVVDIIESLFTSYLINKKTTPANLTSQEKSSFEFLTNKKCLEIQKEHAKRAVWINTVAAIAIAIAIAIWSFATPSISLILGCVLFMSAVNYVKTSSIEKLDTTYAKKLQANIEDIATRSNMEPSSLSPLEQKALKTEALCVKLTEENTQLKRRLTDYQTRLRLFQPVPELRAESTDSLSSDEEQMSELSLVA